MSPTIHVFQRFCAFSNNSHNKGRPAWFDRAALFDHFQKTIGNRPDVKYTAVYDNSHGALSDHFLSEKKGVKVICFDGGDDARSFVNLLDYVLQQDIPETDVVYLLEDDYLHTNSWIQTMHEAFTRDEFDYVTLYDHPDKYGQLYPHLLSSITCTASRHWRTTPSTTNTYACRFRTLKEDASVHYEHCELHNKFTNDHMKFCHLRSNGRVLVSCMPSECTHVENGQLAPVIDWSHEVLQRTSADAIPAHQDT